MKKLDRYIIGKYLTTFFFVVLIFTLIAVVIDFSDKVDEFISKPITAWQILSEYYINFIPYINGLLWPLYAMIAVIFFTSRLAYNSEIISIFGAGVSFQRLTIPYLVAAVVISGLHLVANHYVIPKGNKERLRFEYAYIWEGHDKSKSSNIHMFLSPETKVYVRYYSRKDTVARDFRLETYDGLELRHLLKAKRAEWRGDSVGWQLVDFEQRSFKGLNETLKIGRGEKLDTLINLVPADFVRFSSQREMMTTPELQEFINIERARGLGNTKLYEIEIHRRTAEPFTIIILTLIGLAVASRKVRGGMGLHLAIGIALGAIFIFMSKFSITFATNKALSAWLGVWIPNLFFSMVAVYLLVKAQK